MDDEDDDLFEIQVKRKRQGLFKFKSKDGEKLPAQLVNFEAEDVRWSDSEEEDSKSNNHRDDNLL